MARVKRSVHGRKHHRAVLEQAKGYYGNKSRSYRAANEQLMHSMQYAYRDRRARKGDFRKLWIQRINAAARLNGMSYSRLIAGLHLAGVEVDRKVLADLASPTPTRSRAWSAVAAAALAARRPRRRPRPLPEPALAFSHQRVRRLRRLLAKRATRWAERAFVAEGPELRPRALPRAPGLESLYLAPGGGRAARGRGPGRGRPTRGPGLRAGAGRARAGGRHRHPPARPRRGAHGPPPRSTALGRRRPGGGVRRRARPGQRRHRPAHAPTPPGSAPWSGAATRSIPTTPRRCGLRPGRSSRSPWPSSGDTTEALRALAGRGHRVLRRSPGKAPTTRRWTGTARPPWCWATRPPACPRRCGPWPTRRWPSRWPVGPSRSTSAWPARSCASKRSASGARRVLRCPPMPRPAP